MEPPPHFALTALCERLALPESWLGGPLAAGFADRLAQARRHLREASTQAALQTGPVVVAESEPAAFLAAVLAAGEIGQPVALARPHWTDAERAQAAAQLRPGVWFGEQATGWPDVNPAEAYDSTAWQGTMLIPTGGTGGRVRWAVHTWNSLATAARALEAFLGDGPFTHYSTLPPWHVSGLLPAVRAIETNGRLCLDAWKPLEGGAAPAIAPQRIVISLVPTQLQRLLAHDAVVEWLRGTRAILLGGAAPTAALLAKARELRLPVALAYGMTETAAVVAAQSPADFLAGEPPAVMALPHARTWIAGDDGEPQLPEAPGRVWVEAESLFQGYFPKWREPGPLATDDNGTLDRQGRLHLAGRRDRVIITGGEKVDPRMVEEALRATGLVEDVLVAGTPDTEWGQVVAALYTGEPRTAEELRAALRDRLPPAALPKIWIHTAHLPTDERGKPDPAALLARARR
jgi:O-succinylbenzoic acid--CoA ligase